MKNTFPGGVWPVMLTPFTKEGQVDYNVLENLINWYIKNGVSGLFAVCQSSEMFFLSLEERIKISSFVAKITKGRVPVISSGHISDDFDDQAKEINQIAKTGVDAVILITNRIAKEEESDKVWLENLQKLMDKIEGDIPLGFYECPYPYKRVLTPENIKWCADNGRFYFLKDTCCDLKLIGKKLEVMKGSNLKLYNANTTTLLDSLKKGAAGYSGVMANFHPELYAWLCDNYESNKAEELSDNLTILSLIERQYYPVNAKYYLSKKNIGMETKCRVKDECEMTETFEKEVEMLDRITLKLDKKYIDK